MKRNIKLLTVEMVAKILNVNDWTVRNYFRTGYIPGAFKIHLDWRISQEDLFKWIEFRKNPAKFMWHKVQELYETDEYKQADEGVKLVLETTLFRNWNAEHYISYVENFKYEEQLKKEDEDKK